MQENGVDVITISPGYFYKPEEGPGDGTGEANRAVDWAVQYSIFWAQAAGNEARQHWHGSWRDDDGNKRLDFYAGQDAKEIKDVVPGQRLDVRLRWTSPDDGWNRSNNDLEIHVECTRPDGSRCPEMPDGVWASHEVQNGQDGQPPLDHLGFPTPLHSDYTYRVRTWASNADQRPGQVTFDLHVEQYALDDPIADYSLMHPADNRQSGMITVGALQQNGTTIRADSSRGPTVGTSFSGERLKPEITAPGEVSTPKPDNPAEFVMSNGTSFASPLVAGAAALVKQRLKEQGQDASPARIADFLKRNARDLGPSGPDTTYGYGRLYLPTAEMAVTKTESFLGPIPAITGNGDKIEYTITVRNDGPDAATDVLVFDPLPEGMALTAFTPLANCTLVNVALFWPFSLPLEQFRFTGAVSCTLSTMRPGESIQVTIVTEVVQLPTYPADDVVNRVWAAAAALDRNPANNFAETNADVAWADLAVSAWVASGAIEASQPLMLNDRIGNAGPSQATNVTLKSTLPAGVVYQTATPHACTVSPGSGGATNLTCDYGTIAANSDEVGTIVVVPSSTGTFSTTATVTALQPDPTTPNTATLSVTVSAADVVVTGGVSVSPVAAGGFTRFDFRVTNTALPGQATARNVTLLTEPLPAGLIYTSHVITDPNMNPRPGSSCAYEARRLSCTLGTLVPGEQAWVQLLVTTGLKGTLAISATATAPFDPNPANNQAAPSVSVVPASCSQRPANSVTAVNNGDGRLRVTVAAGTTGEPNNRLEGLRFGAATNGVVEIDGQLYPGGNLTHTFGDGPASFTFYVRRQAGGVATQVPFEILDHCAASWPTFVGGGPAAF